MTKLESKLVKCCQRFGCLPWGKRLILAYSSTTHHYHLLSRRSPNYNNNNLGLVILVTLSPCHTLKYVMHTRSACPVVTREYAKPNRCVFKCFANVSKPKEEDLKATGKIFQLLGPATAKDLKPQSVRWLGTTMSPWLCRFSVSLT